MKLFNRKHKHEWKHWVYAGRKKGAPKSTPMSQVVKCNCGQFAVKHHGETNYTLINN